MTKLNSDRVNKVKENFTFTFKRFAEYRNQQIIDAIIHQKKYNLSHLMIFQELT